MTTTQTAFHQLYTHFDTVEVAYQPRWENGTGYLDHAVSDTTIVHPIQISRAIDSHGRKILLLPQADGKNIVIFQRFAGSDKVIVSNQPRGMDRELAFLILEHEAAKRETVCLSLEQRPMAAEL